MVQYYKYLLVLDVTGNTMILNCVYECLCGFCVESPVAPLPSDIQRSKLEVTLLNRFGVTFGTEGETLTLMANMVVVPDLPNLPPEVMWYRDGKWLALSDIYP